MRILIMKVAYKQHYEMTGQLNIYETLLANKIDLRVNRFRISHYSVVTMPQPQLPNPKEEGHLGGFHNPSTQVMPR